MRTMLGILALLLTTSAWASVEISPEIQQIEKGLESKVQDKIHVIYGDDLKVAVSVHVVTQSPDQEKKGPQNDADVGYAPFAADFTDEKDLGDDKGLTFESIEVDIQAPEDLDDKTVESVKSVVESTLKGLAPKISIAKVPAPKRGLDLNRSKFNIDWKFALTLLAAILVSLILTLGMGFSLHSAANAIASGLKSSSASSVESKTALTLNGGLGGGENGKSKGSSDEKAASPVSIEKEYDRNINIVQQMLRENPLLLVQTLRDSETEWQGLRSLLPALTEEERTTIKRTLGARVSRLTSDDMAEDGALVNSPVWLRDFVERLMLRKVAGGSDIEKALGSDMTIVFSLAHHRSLLEAAKAVDERGAWRILAEFYPKNLMSQLYAEVSEAQWWALVSSLDVTPDEIASAAARMAEMIQNSPHEGVKEERVRFYRSHLLTPMVNYIRSVDPAKDEGVLEDLNRNSPDLADLVKEKVWTSGQLSFVPDEHLKKVLREASYEQKAALLAILPELVSQRLEQLLPEGNVRSITRDQARRIKALPENSAERKQAAEQVRNFLELLRQQSGEGLFTLQDGTGGGEPLQVAA